MPRKKNPNNNYFNESVEEAIHAFNVTTDERERNKLFSIIYPAIAKVAEVWFNKIKPDYVHIPSDELQMDCVTYMLERLHMVKRGKGKAFSYLTVTARNFYIQSNMVAYNRVKKNPITTLSEDKFEIEDVPTNRVEEMEYSAKLFETFMEYININFDKIFPVKHQKLFGSALIEKITAEKDLEGFNRRRFLNELAESTGIHRDTVTKQLSRVASQYSLFRDYFETYGIMPEFKQKLYISPADEKYIREHYQHYSKRHGINALSRKLGINYDILKDWFNNTTL